jgi:diacylglycerol kinase family enzyme
MRAALSQSHTAVEGPATTAPLFVVINPGSGEHDAAATQEQLAGIFREAGRASRFVPLAAPSMLFEACRSAALQARAQAGILVIAGGDGSVNTAARAALAHGCPLGVIPQGTFNYLARDHGIPLDTDAAAAALLRARSRPVPVGTVNGEVFLVNASLGLYPRLLQDREAFKARLGRHRWVAVLAGLATLVQWRRQLALDIELDGQRRAVATSTLFVGNNRLQVEQVGLDDDVTEPMRAGRLAGVVIRPIGLVATLGLVLRGALGRLGDADPVDSFSFERLDVRVRGQRRIKIAFDGEVRRMAPPLHFSVAPDALRLMVPVAADRVARE